MKLIQNIVCSAVALFCATASLHAEGVTVASPDGKYCFTVTDEGGQLSYTLTWEGREVIKPSVLGIEVNNNTRPVVGKGLWLSGVQILDVETSACDSVWHPVYGERNTIREQYNGCKIVVGKRERRDRLAVEVRAYNEGVAFRYHFPVGQYFKVTEEYTEFTMPEGTMAYWTERAQTPYELLPLANWRGESDRPLMLTLADGGFVCLGEAQVVDYVRTKFSLSATKPNTLTTAMYGTVEDIAPYNTPWRLMMCAHTAGEILEHNDLYLNLNPPCQIADTSWIKPGKVMREVTLTTEGAKATVDFVAKHNMQYIMFDAGWYGAEGDKASDATTVTLDPARNPQIDALDLPEVIAYAKERGVGVILYVNMRALQQQLDDILPLYKQWGVAGIKFGFVQVGSQVWTKWMHEAVAKCARYGLMVDIHDEYRPTGFSRTYPNLMTQEGIRGNEEFPDATHNVTLPFTRYVCGAADYTICYYRQDFERKTDNNDAYGVPRSRFIKTTAAHQLALAAIYYSPLQLIYWYDKPSDCQDEPETKFFDDVYTTWDDTRVLQGAIGEYIVVARKRGDEWFVGAITNNDSRQISIPLNFLDNNRNYLAEIYTDGDETIPTRTKVACTQKRVKAKNVLDFDLKPSGGVAIRLTLQ